MSDRLIEIEKTDKELNEISEKIFKLNDLIRNNFNNLSLNQDMDGSKKEIDDQLNVIKKDLEKKVNELYNVANYNYFDKLALDIKLNEIGKSRVSHNDSNRKNSKK